MADKLSVTPQQLTALCLLDAQMAQLQIAANQTGAALQMPEVGDAFLAAQASLGAAKERLVAGWSRTIQVAQPADMARLVTS